MKNQIHTYTHLKILIIIPFLSLLLAGYSFPNQAPYLLVKDNFGTSKLYLARNMIDYVYIDENDNNIINMYSGNLYGYVNNVRVTFPTYDQAYYNSGYNSVNYNVTEIVENHLYDKVNWLYSYKKDLLIISLLGGVILCLMVLSLKS